MSGSKTKWRALVLFCALPFFVSEAASAAPAPRAPEDLKVATYNVWGLPSPLLRHGERWDELPQAINALDADVVLIQEAFTSKAEALTELARYPYSAHGPRSKFLHFSSGLLILSRYPIVETAKITYARCGGFDCFANKGAIYARIRLPDGREVSVFNTHLNANGYDEVRASQAAHLMRFVRAYSQGLPTVVGGDFNGDGKSLFARASRALDVRDTRTEFAGGHPGATREARDGFTADPLHNPFLGRSETRRRLDHIYLLAGGRAPDWKLLSYGLFFDGVHGKVLSDHFGVKVTARLSS